MVFNVTILFVIDNRPAVPRQWSRCIGCMVDLRIGLRHWCDFSPAPGDKLSLRSPSRVEGSPELARPLVVESESPQGREKDLSLGFIFDFVRKTLPFRINSQ